MGLYLRLTYGSVIGLMVDSLQVVLAQVSTSLMADSTVSCHPTEGPVGADPPGTRLHKQTRHL